MTWRIVFLGSPAFAVPSLAALIADERFEIPLVVSQPDRPAGRGRKLTPPPVAAFATESGIPLFQPESLKSDDAVERLRLVEPDLLLVVAYGEILRKNVLTLAPAGALNVHPSLLPSYRGAAPINAAILNGDEQTGVSIIKLVRRLDAGPLVALRTAPVEPNDTTGTLGERLAQIAGDMLPDACAGWLDGSLEAVPQDDDRATYTREWVKSDAEINWSWPAARIERLIRAALPWPVAWTTLHGQRVQIRSATVDTEPDQPAQAPGTLFRRSGRIAVSTGDGELLLDQVQPQGKQAMPAANWWNGLPQDTPNAFETPTE